MAGALPVFTCTNKTQNITSVPVFWQEATSASCHITLMAANASVCCTHWASTFAMHRYVTTCHHMSPTHSAPSYIGDLGPI